MRNLYLICLSDEQAAKMELMLGGRIEIRPSAGHLDEVQHDPSRAIIASLDAVGFNGELAAVADRLATSGPRYHHGGPQPGRRHWPQAPLNDELAERERLRLAAGPDPYGGRGIRVGDHWEPPVGEAPSDKALGLSPAEAASEPQPALVTCCPGGEPYYTDTGHHADGSRCWHRPA